MRYVGSCTIIRDQAIKYLGVQCVGGETQIFPLNSVTNKSQLSIGHGEINCTIPQFPLALHLILAIERNTNLFEIRIGSWEEPTCHLLPEQGREHQKRLCSAGHRRLGGSEQ